MLTTETPTPIPETLPHSKVPHDPISENIPEEVPKVSFLLPQNI